VRTRFVSISRAISRRHRRRHHRGRGTSHFITSEPVIETISEITPGRSGEIPKGFPRSPRVADLFTQRPTASIHRARRADENRNSGNVPSIIGIGGEFLRQSEPRMPLSIPRPARALLFRLKIYIRVSDLCGKPRYIKLRRRNTSPSVEDTRASDERVLPPPPPFSTAPFLTPSARARVEKFC